MIHACMTTRATVREGTLPVDTDNARTITRFKAGYMYFTFYKGFAIRRYDFFEKIHNDILSKKSLFSYNAG